MLRIRTKSYSRRIGNCAHDGVSPGILRNHEFQGRHEGFE